MAHQELCDPKHPDAVKVALVQMANGNIEWVTATSVQDGEKVFQTVTTLRPPLLAR